MTPAYLRGLRDLGVNRLSLGVQSARDDELRLLGRIHTRAQAMETVEAARAADFGNLSLDFIFGLPGQTLPRWRETLEAALSLEPEHLSLYALSVEEGTALEQRIVSGELPPPDDDLAAEMYELAEEMLAQAGFFHYEISNWAGMNCESRVWWSELEAVSEDISPFVCRHNLAYWRNERWLGVGAGAHSWLGGRRWGNVRHPREYIAALEQGSAPVAEVEEIDRQHDVQLQAGTKCSLLALKGVIIVYFSIRDALPHGHKFTLFKCAEYSWNRWRGDQRPSIEPGQPVRPPHRLASPTARSGSSGLLVV